jgi:hypothetical protein
MTRPNPFALSICGNFVVERQEGDVFPTVMLVREALARQRRCERDGARYEGEADRCRLQGDMPSMEYAMGFARVNLTQAAEIAEALNGVYFGRKAA